jgi:hypothetical protein
MSATTTLSRRREPPVANGRRLTPTAALQQCYETAVAALAEHGPEIDAWLAEREPELWQHIREEDDELLRLRQLGVSARTYETRLQIFLKLCEQAEQYYYEAQPVELSLPPLAKGESVAVYYELTDGTLHKANV